MTSTDPLEGKTNEEVVAAFRKWAYHLANQKAKPADIDDVAQEALIAIWRKLEQKGGKANTAASFLADVGRHRATAVMTGAYPLGHDSRPGPRPDPKNAVHVELMEADGVEDSGGIDTLEMTNSIVEALLTLAPEDREYVYERFWEGKSDVEIALDRGVSNKNLSQNWHRRIKPALTLALSTAA
jgi:DNA-directed RNA polymerase specialized sigma24 family protein